MKKEELITKLKHLSNGINEDSNCLEIEEVGYQIIDLLLEYVNDKDVRGAVDEIPF